MTGLETLGDPAWDRAVDEADAESEPEVRCGSKVTTAEGMHLCQYAAGHAGPCSWALTAPSATGEGEP